MANTPRPKAVTSRTKRWRDRMTLLQNALRARESIQRTTEALDNIMRQLVEEEALDAEPAVPSQHPSQRPTQFHEALSGNVFISLVMKRWSESKTDAQRAQVIELAERGHASGTISNEEKAQLDEVLK